jgi:catechol 2,3-dioxygenase-like lactoylglutathione lyase family enzyme
MAYRHLALATLGMKGIDHFYREVMGFDLKKVEIGPMPQGGWAKHFFYEIEPDRFIAFWELHGEPYAKPFETGLSKAAGLPEWVNGIQGKSGRLKCQIRRSQRRSSRPCVPVPYVPASRWRDTRRLHRLPHQLPNAPS